MNPIPTPPDASAPDWLRPLRLLAGIALALVLSLLLFPALVGYLPFTRVPFARTFDQFDNFPALAASLTLLGIIAPSLVLILLVLWKRRFAWPLIAAGWVLAVGVIGWLARDEATVRQPLTMEDFSPAAPGDAQSYALLMQYSKGAPSAEAKVFNQIHWDYAVAAATVIKDPAALVAWLTQHGSQVEKEWTQLAPQWHWLGALNGSARIGDLTPPALDANIMAFACWRTLTQHAVIMADLQAVNGRGDEAMDILLPQLEVSQKLQRNARTLVRAMIGNVIERMTLENIGFVLDQTKISPRAQARLKAALAGHDTPMLARRVIMDEYIFFQAFLKSRPLGDQVSAWRSPPVGGDSFCRSAINLVGPVLLNPNASINIYGALSNDLARLAGSRDLAGLAARSKLFNDTMANQAGMKNLAGHLLLGAFIPAYDKVIEALWKAADLRVALQNRLAAA